MFFKFVKFKILSISKVQMLLIHLKLNRLCWFNTTANSKFMLMGKICKHGCFLLLFKTRTFPQQKFYQILGKFASERWNNCRVNTWRGIHQHDRQQLIQLLLKDPVQGGVVGCPTGRITCWNIWRNYSYHVTSFGKRGIVKRPLKKNHGLSPFLNCK